MKGELKIMDIQKYDINCQKLLIFMKMQLLILGASTKTINKINNLAIDKIAEGRLFLMNKMNLTSQDADFY